MSASSAFQQSLAAGEHVDPWPEPRRVPSDLPTVPEFDIDMLPLPLQPWIADIAERMQAPAEYIAVAAVIAAGSVIGRKVGIRPQERTDWHEVPNLWGCIVGRPGVMKSPALQVALQPLQRLQANARKDYDLRVVQYEAGEIERDLRSDAYKSAVKARIKNDLTASTADLVCPHEDEPVLRRYIVNDTSYQSLGELLRQNPNGLLVHRDELLSLLKSLDREDNIEARGFYLTAWAGTDSYTFDRIGRGLNLHVPSLTISMIGSAQPGRLREYISGAIRGGASDDGLIQRFGLLVWPDVAGEWVEHDRDPEPEARAAAFAAFDRLSRMTAQEVGAQIDPFDDSRPFLRFDGEAREMFQSWRRNLEARLRSDELHPALESHLAKYRKLAPALALIHHLLGSEGGPVGVLSVLSALTWAEFLERHAARAYGAAIDSSADGAREILRHLRNGDLGTTFSLRDVQRPCWHGLMDRTLIAEALDLLEDHGWIRARDNEAGPKGGRPTRTYTVNPKGLNR